MLTINDLTPEEREELDTFLATVAENRRLKQINNHPLLAKIKRYGEVCEDLHSEYDDKAEIAGRQADILWEEIVNYVLGIQHARG